MSQFAMDNTPAAPPPFSQSLPQFPLAAKWPTAIGLVSLILGIGQLIGSMVQAVSLGFTIYQMSGNSPFQTNGSVFGALLFALPGLVGGLLLVVAAILLLRRRPLARAMHYAYAVVSLLLGFLAIAAFSKLFGEDSFSSAFIVGGLTTLVQAYPIFCLIWFSRADVRLDIHEMGEPATET